MMNPAVVTNRRSPNCLSDFALDRYRLGEFAGVPESERASTHLNACEPCRSRLAEMEAVVAPALDYVAAPTGSEPQAVNPRRSWRMRALWFAPVLAAAVAALLLVPGHELKNGIKGGSWYLGVVAQYPNGRVTGVAQGAALAPGDCVRFEVKAPVDGFVSIISLDSEGKVTPFSPVAGDTVPVRAGQQRLLDGAVRLDGAIGPERLLLLACPGPMAVAEVVAAGRTALARAQGRLDQVSKLDLPCSQSSFWIRKEVRP